MSKLHRITISFRDADADFINFIKKQNNISLSIRFLITNWVKNHPEVNTDFITYLMSSNSSTPSIPETSNDNKNISDNDLDDDRNDSDDIENNSDDNKNNLKDSDNDFYNLDNWDEWDDDFNNS